MEHTKHILDNQNRLPTLPQTITNINNPDVFQIGWNLYFPWDKNEILANGMQRFVKLTLEKKIIRHQALSEFP